MLSLEKTQENFVPVVVANGEGSHPMSYTARSFQLLCMTTQPDMFLKNTHTYLHVWLANDENALTFSDVAVTDSPVSSRPSSPFTSLSCVCCRERFLDEFNLFLRCRTLSSSTVLMKSSKIQTCTQIL